MRLRPAAFLFLACGCNPEKPARRIDSMTVEITGCRMEWIVRYPGEDAVLGTADDVTDRQDLHVPLGAEITIELKSADYVYSLALPSLKCREIAVPDLRFSMTFRPSVPGVFEIQGDNMCGGAHSALQGRLIVETEPEFRAWLKKGARK